MSNAQLLIGVVLLINSICLGWLFIKKEDTGAEIRAVRREIPTGYEITSIAEEAIWKETGVPKILDRGMGLSETWLTCLEMTLGKRVQEKQDQDKNQCLSCHQKLPKEKP